MNSHAVFIFIHRIYIQQTNSIENPQFPFPNTCNKVQIQFIYNLENELSIFDIACQSSYTQTDGKWDFLTIATLYYHNLGVHYYVYQNDILNWFNKLLLNMPNNK